MFAKKLSISTVVERLKSPLARRREDLPLTVRAVRTRRRGERLRAWLLFSVAAVAPAVILATHALMYWQHEIGTRKAIPLFGIVNLIETWALFAIIGLALSWVFLLCKRSLKSFLIAGVVGVGGLLVVTELLFGSGHQHNSHFLRDAVFLGVVTGLLSGLFAYGLVKWRKLDWWT